MSGKEAFLFLEHIYIFMEYVMKPYSMVMRRLIEAASTVCHFEVMLRRIIVPLLLDGSGGC